MTKHIDIPEFITWATMVAAAHPEDEREEAIRQMAEEYPELCPCCLLKFIVDREIARGCGEDVSPLVSFRER